MIDLDDQTTWPQHVLDLLAESETVLISYLKEEERLDGEREDLKKRGPLASPRPANKYFEDRAKRLLALKHLVQDEQTLGYHCTRLTNKEVAKIEAEGLSLLSPELLLSRIEVVSPSILQDDVFERLVTVNSSADLYRRNQVCFLAGVADLRFETDTAVLFRYWGGEALRDLYEDCPKIMSILAAVGRPRLILAKVNLADSECYQSFHEALANGFLAFRHNCKLSLGCDVFCKKPVEARNIVDVFDQNDDRFEEIVRTRSWSTPLS